PATGASATPISISATSTAARIASHGGRARQATCHEACGYVDDPLRGPAALPPCSPEEGEHGEMLAFAHIPTGATATTGLNRLTKVSTMSPVQSVNHLSGCTGGRGDKRPASSWRRGPHLESSPTSWGR